MTRDDYLTPDDITAPLGAVIDTDPDDYQGTKARASLIEVDEVTVAERQPAIKIRQTLDTILYRAIPSRDVPGQAWRRARGTGGLVICRTHVVELRHFRFAGEPLRVAAIGVRERMQSYDRPACGMCAVVVSHGNKCYRDACATPLHPQWPAVYCSTECALEDR